MPDHHRVRGLPSTPYFSLGSVFVVVGCGGIAVIVVVLWQIRVPGVQTLQFIYIYILRIPSGEKIEIFLGLCDKSFFEVFLSVPLYFSRSVRGMLLLGCACVSRLFGY